MIDDGKVGSLKCIEVGVPARMVIHRAFPFDSFDVTFIYDDRRGVGL